MKAPSPSDPVDTESLAMSHTFHAAGDNFALDPPAPAYQTHAGLSSGNGSTVRLGEQQNGNETDVQQKDRRQEFQAHVSPRSALRAIGCRL
ncbi:hypothetical protein BM1_05921 [Bipolaris maydis]|nr:hypothetical protein BM1_05921 [Bipolaris maydis]